MITSLTYAILRALLALGVSVGGTHAAPVSHHHAAVAVPAPVATPSPASAEPTETPCATALAYLRVHGNPAFEMKCEPGSLPGGLAAVTCWKATSLGVSCPDGGLVVISQPTCAISYENEASNSWLDFATLTPGTINGRARHDASGRTVDPFGECG